MFECPLSLNVMMMFYIYQMYIYIYTYISLQFNIKYTTIVINAHIVYVYAPCGPLIGESINL